MIVLGIAGGTASGKTTVTDAFVASLGKRASLISHDCYYRTLPEAFHAHPERYNFDEPAALESTLLALHIEQLRRGETAMIPTYDFAAHARSGATPLSPTPILVVEGILLFADDALANAFDKRVFVDAPNDVRLARRVRRDVLERGRSVDGVLEQYLHTVRPMHETWVEPARHGVDLLLDGTAPIPESLDLLHRLLDGLHPV